MGTFRFAGQKSRCKVTVH